MKRTVINRGSESPKPPVLEDLLSPQDLADRYGVPLGTVYAWNYRSTGPRCLVIGKHIRFRVSDVAAWEDGHAKERLAASWTPRQAGGGRDRGKRTVTATIASAIEPGRRD